MPDPTTHVERYTRATVDAAILYGNGGSVPDYVMLGELFVMAVLEVVASDPAAHQAGARAEDEGPRS